MIPLKKLKKAFYKTGNVNIVEATRFIRFLCRLVGLSMQDIHIMPFGDLEVSFSWLGIVTSTLGMFAYGWSAYCVNAYRETIILSVYDSMLGFYGEYIESFITTVAVVCCWFQMLSANRDKSYWNYILRIDAGIRKLCGGSFCEKLQRQLFAVACIWFAVFIYAFSSFGSRAAIWISDFPLAKLFHTMYSLNIVLLSLVCYHFHAFVLETRCFHLNEILKCIAKSTSTNTCADVNVINVKDAKCKPRKNSSAQELSAAEIINSVSKIFSEIQVLRVEADRRMGTIAVTIIFMSFATMIIRIFYVIEATAGGLYRDLNRYSVFLFSNLEYIIIALMSLCAIIHACERVYGEALKTAGIVHRIIQQQFNEDITKQAMLLSLQLLHQQHKFTANGLFNLDKSLLLSVTGSVTTYITILLQFATSAGATSTAAGLDDSSVHGASSVQKPNLTHNMP